MATGAHLFKHGMSKLVEYPVWNMMMQRCYNSANKNYKDYGGRGILVCARWREFPNFYVDMGSRPSSKHSIDRIDVEGNYEPSNCRWASATVQVRNRRDTKYLTVGGVKKPLAEWAEDRGMKASTLRQRVYVYGWSEERAVLTV